MSEATQLPPFRPHPLLRHRDLMTIAGALPRPRLARALRASGTERIMRVDERNRVRIFTHPQADPDAPTMVVVHGLVGSSEAPYVLGAADQALGRGFHVVRADVPGCGDTETLAGDAYHGGRTKDLRAIGDQLHAEGHRRIYLLGFSLGGSMVLKLAGEAGDAPPPWLAGVATVSAAVDFSASADALGTTLFNRICQWRFLRDLKRIVRRWSAVHRPDLDLGELDAIRDLRTFDDRFTARLGGFDGVDDYYARASAFPYVGGIAVPTLVLTARDDPLVPFHTLDRPEITAHPRIRFEATATGGHTAFVGGGSPPRPTAPPGPPAGPGSRHWAEARAVEFCAALEGAAC